MVIPFSSLALRVRYTLSLLICVRCFELKRLAVSVSPFIQRFSSAIRLSFVIPDIPISSSLPLYLKTPRQTYHQANKIYPVPEPLAPNLLLEPDMQQRNKKTADFNGEILNGKNGVF
jgi:hypothetical protein